MPRILTFKKGSRRALSVVGAVVITSFIAGSAHALNLFTEPQKIPANEKSDPNFIKKNNKNGQFDPDFLEEIRFLLKNRILEESRTGFPAELRPLFPEFFPPSRSAKASDDSRGGAKSTARAGSGDKDDDKKARDYRREQTRAAQGTANGLAFRKFATINAGPDGSQQDPPSMFGYRLNLRTCALEDGESLILVNEEEATDPSNDQPTIRKRSQLFDKQSLAEWGGKSAFYNSGRFRYYVLSAQNDVEKRCKIDYLSTPLLPRSLREAETKPAAADSLSLQDAIAQLVLTTSGAATPSPQAAESPDAIAQKLAQKIKTSTGRIYPGGCTAFLIEGSAYALTAGHCCCDERCSDDQWRNCRHLGASLVQFNVPDSIDGRIQHPDPADQYPIIRDFSHLDFDGQGCKKIGNDWAVLKLGNNNPLDRSPRSAPQNQPGLRIGQSPENPIGDVSRVMTIGYGVNFDNRDKHLSRQVKLGRPKRCAVDGIDTCLKYTTKNTKGASGAPVLALDDSNRPVVIGIHTDGFPCDCDGPVDAGTSFVHKTLWCAATRGGDDSQDACLAN